MNDTDRFFEAPYEHFFNPLTGPLRELVYASLRALYLRINGPSADYEASLSRDDVISCFCGAIVHTPVLSDPANEDQDGRIAGEGSILDRAGSVLRKLQATGWIETYSDPTTLRKALRFTGRGQDMARVLARDQDDVLAMTQAVQSTLAHVRAAAEAGKAGQAPYQDIMIATKLSADIVFDLNNVIRDLAEQKLHFARSMDRKMALAKAAGDDFLDYLQNRVVPDIESRFSADSVERCRTYIIEATDEIEALPADVKAEIERRLRRYFPSLLEDANVGGGRQSILVWALRRIRMQVNRACDAKLPELRRETRSLMRQAERLMQHLRTMHLGGMHRTVSESIRLISQLSPAARDALLSRKDVGVPALRVQLINPAKIEAREARPRAVIDDRVPIAAPLSPREKFHLEVARRTSGLGVVSPVRLRARIIEAMGEGGRVQASALDPETLEDLGILLAAPGLVAQQKGFRLSTSPSRFDHRFGNSSDYVIDHVEGPLQPKDTTT